MKGRITRVRRFALTLALLAAACATKHPAPPRSPVVIPNALMPEDGVLVGGQPTESQIRELAARGYRTVVNLRGPGEEGSWDEAPLAAELGMEFIEISIAGREELNEANARRLGEILERPEAHPMVVHCASGNRVGALFALEAFHGQGTGPEESLRIGLDYGLTRLEPFVREQLGLPPKEE